MQQVNTNTQEAAKLWWSYIIEKDAAVLRMQYFQTKKVLTDDQILSIYEKEVSTPTPLNIISEEGVENNIRESFKNMHKKEVVTVDSVGYTAGNWAVRDYEVIGPYGSNKTICEMTGNLPKEEKKANAKRIVTCANGWDNLEKEVKLWKDAHNIECTVTALYKDENDKLKADNESLVIALKDSMWFIQTFEDSDHAWTREQVKELTTTAKALLNKIEEKQ